MNPVVPTRNDTLVGRLGLRDEVLSLAGYAVVVGPAMDLGKLRSPVTVDGRRVRCVPLERRGAPGIGIGLFSLPDAPDHVDEEEDLGCADNQGRHARGALPFVFDGSLESWAFLLEVFVGAVIPGTLLLCPQVRYHRMRLFGCVVAVIIGVVLNRLNVSVIGMAATSTVAYLPSWIEILVSAGIVAGGLLVLGVMNQYLPVDRAPVRTA